MCGTGCNVGTVSGIARVIDSIEDIDKLQKDDILVTKYTDATDIRTKAKPDKTGVALVLFFVIRAFSGQNDKCHIKQRRKT